MGEAKSSNERKNLVIKTLIVVVLLLLAFLSTVIYIFAYPKTTVILHDDETAAFKVLSQFKVKKYSRLGELAAHEKNGYTFLYWAYEDDSIFNPNAELDMDELSLYATYSRNSYTITYHVQVYNEDAEQEGYTSNQAGYRTRTELFGETIRLPYGTVGDVANAELLPELQNRIGYHFAGWTTKVAEEEVMPETDVYNAGGDFVIPAGDVDLYAYWEKNEYEVVAHTGNEYEMEEDGLTPKQDADGNFIIRNNRVQEIKTLKYLDAISGITTNIQASLDDSDGLVVEGVNIEDYKEYDFMGWYLDANYTIPANAEYTARVSVVNGEEIPYLEYVDDYGNVYVVNSVLSDDGKYQFHLYSKWERRSYTVTFSNNHSGSNGKLDPITIYKYDDHYGKYYYHTIDLKEVTTSKYLSSNKGYQFFAWSTTAQATDPECVTYYQWLQDPISYDANGSIIESDPYYDFFTYRHEVSEDRTFYTLWSRIRSVTFYQKNGSNRFNGASFVIEGIAKQWFKLPGADYVLDKESGATIANSWTINDYQYFAGWRVGSGTTGEPILEKNTNGTDNKEYYWIFSSTSTTSVTICAYWESIQYKIEYYLNDGTDNKLDDVYATGGKKTYYAGAPSRENYIFDGWSTEKYVDNTPKSAKTTYTSANSFVPRGSETTIRFYASWTMNFAIGYDTGVVDDSVTGTLPTGIQYSKKGSELKMTLSVGSGSALKRTGYTFKGWVLKNQDGSYNTDIIFKAGNSVVFNFAGIDVTKGNTEGYCYISGIANKQYSFFMDSTDVNYVKLYAYWEAKQYTITIHDTASGGTIVQDVKYGQDFNFLDYITTDYVGKKFIGISASATGPIIYSPDSGMIIYGTDIIGDLVFYTRYEIREIYVKYMIKAEDANMAEDVEFTPAYGYSGYGNKPVLYNDVLNLPTPSAYNANYKFTHWYYIELGEDGSGTQVPVYTDDRLEYEGDTLTLWANYVEETYTLTFKFINPLDTSDITTIDKTIDGDLFLVTKGSGIPSEYYAYITTLLTSYEKEKGIVEFNLEGLFNTYQGQAYEFVNGQIVNAGNYPAIQSSNVLTFVTVWTANEVKFVYYSGEDGDAEMNSSYHTGMTFESTDSILLQDVTFDNLNDGESVYRWYIKVQTDNAGDKLYLDKGSYLVGFKGQFASISEMRDYISWAEVNGRYVGTIKIYAETQQLFTISYNRINSGTLEELRTVTHVYDGLANVLSLMSSVDALDGFGTGLIFNGWVIYSSNGRVANIGDNGLVSSGSLTLDPTVFADFKVFCYADISYVVDYNYLALSDGKFYTTDLKEDYITLIKDRELDYTISSNYYTYHTIDSVVSLDADIIDTYTANGYEYYGYEINGVVYSKTAINNQFTIEITGDKIVILCYVVTTRTITYKLGSTITESFTSSNLIGSESVTYTYVLGYNNKVVAERVFTSASVYVDNATTAVSIKDISVYKDGYLFTGWQQIKDGTLYADIYKAGDVIYLSENITFVTYFTTPEAGTIKGYVKYNDVDGTLLQQVEVWNGTEHTLIDGEGLGNYDNNIYSAIYSWKYEGVEYRIGENFSIPLLINAGQTFEFTAIVKDKYIIAFETYTDTKPSSITTFADVENTLVGIPTLADDIEFSHWRFELVDDENETSETITIAYNDTIAFKKSDGVVPVKYSCTAMLGGYNLHIIPVRYGVHIYTLEAVALTEITITLTATSGDNSHTDTLTVEYGATYQDPRDLLSAEMLALETVDRGICAWTTDSSKTDIDLYTEEGAEALQNNITKITKRGLQLYAVWQTKYTVTYAVENDDFGYKDYTPSASYHFEGDTVEFDVNVLKSIYYKGYNTVYYDNGTYIVHSASGNDYYYVAGFVATFEGSNTTQTYLLSDGSFKMMGANVTLTPITKTITYRVDFMENATTTDDAVLNTIYTPDVYKLNIDEHSAVRSNFKFLGWNTDADAEEAMTADDVSKLANQNTTFYAVWASNIFISFSYNGAELFKIPLNKQGKLSASKVDYYMSMEEETIDNGYLVFKSLNGSDRTYNYADNYIYLNQYVYNNKAYITIEELCAVNFTMSSTVNLMFDRIYTVNYLSSDPTDEEAEIATISSAYFTVLGQITSTGLSTFVTAEKPEDYANKYYQTSGWVDINNNFYNFEEEVNENKLATLVQFADKYVVTMELDWSAKSFEIVLNYTATPYTDFKAYSTQEEVIANTNWTNIASTNITDEEGSVVSTTSTVTLVYGSSFVVQFDNDILENYMLIGWSTTLYPLGFNGSDDTTDILYRYMSGSYMYNYSETVLFDYKFLGDNTSLVMYPVFVAVPSHTVHIESSNGNFTYSVVSDESMKVGYMADLAEAEGSSDFNSQEVSLYFYSILTVTADQPSNEYFKFDSIVTTIGSVSDNVVTIKGTDTGGCTDYDSCHEEVEITYVIKTITINAKLDYTRELKDSTSDTSQIALSAGDGSVTLSYTSSTATLVIPANSELGAVVTLSEHFKMSSIMSGENSISIINHKINIMTLSLNESDVAELVFTIAPRSYNITLELQGGSIGDIEYTSEVFGDGVIIYADSTFEVVYDAFITLPTPTLDLYIFNYWYIGNTKYASITDYEVTSNMIISANFSKNAYLAEYALEGSTDTVSVVFVGGQNIVVGRDADNNLISDNTAVGYTHIGWTERKTTYYDDDTLTTDTRDYEFKQIVKGEDITINYVYATEDQLTTTLASIKVEYGTDFAMPQLSDLVTNNVDGMMLYGFATTADEEAQGRKIFALGQEKINFKDDLGYEIVDSSTAREITLYAVYYQKYTYTFVYGTTDYPTTIATETYEIGAINIAKEVNAGDLSYTINSTIPTPPTTDEIFSGYNVAYEISGETTNIMNSDGTALAVISAGETITLEDPKNHNYVANIKYIFTPKYEASSGAQEIKLYITNPTNTSENLVVTYEDTNGSTINGEYYPIRVLLSNKFYVASTPSYVYNKALQTDELVTWTIASNNKTFTTENASLVAYKLLGYIVTYTVEGTTITKNIRFDNPTEGHALAGGSDYELRPIWEARYAVRYYDVDGNEIVSATEYYDQGTELVVESIVDENDNYDRTGYVFVGYAETADATIKYTSDFYAFEQSFIVLDKDYNFYPAYSKIYTINLATNGVILNSNGGNSDYIVVTQNKRAATTYVGGPAVSLSEYFKVRYANENGEIVSGYSFGGFTLKSGKLANELETEDFITEYTLNSDDLDDNDTLYIYVAWERAGYTVTFVMSATYKNGVYADSEKYEKEYFHNEIVNKDNLLEDTTLATKISELEKTYFVFNNFSYADGEVISGDVVVDRKNITIYVNFNYTYTIVYNLVEYTTRNTDNPTKATYKSEDVTEIPEDGTVRGPVGSTAVMYNADLNLLVEGLSDLYWTVNDSLDNFFDSNGEHTFTTADLDYADNNYKINLYLTGSTAKYTVNLHYFKTFADLDASYTKLQSMDTPDYTQLNYSVMTLEDVEYGTELLEISDDIELDENYMPVTSPYSIFNNQIASVFAGQTYVYEGTTYQIDDLYDILCMYSEQGYNSEDDVVINNTNKVALCSLIDDPYYFAQTYTGADTYVNNVYIVYGLRYFRSEITTYLVDEDATIVNNSSLEYDKLDNITTQFAIGDRTKSVDNSYKIATATIKDMIVFTPTEESASNNLGYNFIGVYSAEYDSDGNIVQFVELSSEDWTKGASNTYYIKQSNSVYIFYSEKQVKVTVQYSSPDKTYDNLDLSVLLDNESADGRISKQTEGMTITALYGQTLKISNASKMPYYISYMLMAVGGSNIRFDTSELNYELVSDDDTVLEEITIVIYFKIQMVDVYFYTHTESPFEDGGSFRGTIESITYEDALNVQYIVDANDIDYTYKYCKYDNLYYNFVTELPYGSTITAITVQLNNYSVSKWILNGSEDVTSLGVVVGNDTHLKVEFEANDITVEFYTSSLDGEDYATKISAFTISNIKYGDYITLPYAFIEEELYVSKGWLIGGIAFDWGVKTPAVIYGNDQLDNNVLKVYANSINKYYLVFANDSSEIDLAIPDDYKERNELIVSEYTIQMPGSTTTYTYVNANDTKNIKTESKTISKATDVITGYVEIPEELQYSNNLEFGGWATKQSTVVVDKYVFSIAHITNTDTHEIKLTMLDSGMVILKFYITNPEYTEDSSKDFNLSVTAGSSASFDIPYIQMIYNTNGTISTFITPVASTTSAIVQWGSYFADDTDVNLLDNYEFHGWSITRQGVLNMPSSEYANIEDNSALMYSYGSGSSRTKYGNNNLLSQLDNLLKAEHYELYTVWEAKHTIIFDADDESYTNGFRLENKYAQGEVVALPNNVDKSSSAYYDLQYGSKKLKGWEDANVGVERLFSDLTSGVYTYVVPAQDLTFTPVWEDGTIVLFNTNFGQWREYFAETMAANNDGVSADSILSLIGYPYLTEDALEVFEYAEYSSTSVNGTQYTTSFREGTYWCTGEVIPVYKYAETAFSQDSIYSLYGSGNYFNLLGWYIDNNNNGTYESDTDTLITTTNADGAIILTLTDDMVASGVLTIYALWEPKNVEVRFYYTQVSAINASTATNADDKNLKRYSGTDDTTGEVGYTIVYVPFGGKITSESAYATDTTIYMYDGYNAFMKDPTQVYNMNVLQQERIFYRFNYWSQIYTNDNILNNRATDDTPIANAISDPIMEDLYLYPTFHDQYVVQFKSTLGGYISSDLTQYVIDGETIQIGLAVKKILNLELIDEGYYYRLGENGEETVSLISSSTNLLEDGLTFEVTSFKIVDSYVTIYISIKLVVNAYLPNFEDSTPKIQQWKSIEIDINTTYDPQSMFTLTEGVLADYGYPDFAGWFYSTPGNESYYSNPDGAPYKLSTSGEVESFSVTTGTSSGTIQYYLRLNDSTDLIKLEEVNGGLSVCLYAHLVTTTTIEVPSNATSFAKLEYSADSSDYYEIDDSRSTSQKLVYYSAYNSPYAPNVTVDLTYGYTITDVTHLTSEFESTFNASDNVDKEYIEADEKFKANIIKTTVNDVVTEDSTTSNNLKVSFDFKISRIKKCNKLVFKLTIEYITFNVNYVYNSTQSVLQYYKDSTYQTFATNIDGTLITSGTLELSDTRNPLYVGSYSTTYSFALSYAITTVGEITTVQLTGVPYGTTLQFKLAPISYLGESDIYGSLKYHFAYWAVTATGVENCNADLVGSFTNTAQKYTPVTFTGSTLVREYTVTGTMEQNKISKIVYKFVVPTKIGNEWKALVETLQKDDNVVESYDSTLGYIISWSVYTDTNGLPPPDSEGSEGYENIKAGDDITSLLERMGEQYQSQFNSEIASGTAMNLSILLNYMWFDNSWNTFPSDLDNKVCHLDSTTEVGKNRLYFDVEGVVTLYSKLSEAVLVKATSQVVDYINTSLELSVDRADVALNAINSVNKDSLDSSKACILSDDGNNIAVKVPYGAKISFEVNPDGASSVHSAYTIYNWSANTGSKDVELTTNTTSTKIEFKADSEDYFITNAKVKYPEYSLIAKVIIDTYVVNFYNDNGALIKEYRLGYDSELAATENEEYRLRFGLPLTEEGYSKYGLSLVGWRNLMTKVPDKQPPEESTQKITLPLFDLDSEADRASITFRHSGDPTNGSFGQYKYLFSHWSLDTNIYSGVIVNYTSGQYNTVNLYANYAENTAVVYTILDINSDALKNNNSDIYYLPIVDESTGYFTDMFGNSYSDSLFKLTSAINWLKDNSNGGYTGGDLYVGNASVSASSASTFVDATQVSTLRAAKSNTYSTITVSDIECIQIYPSIPYTVFIYDDGSTDRQVTIDTLGGVYSVNMTSNGNLRFNNIISISGVPNNKPLVVAVSDASKQFAYWEVWKNSPYSVFETPEIVYNIASSEYLLNATKIINSHFNAKVNFSQENTEYGTFKIYAGNGASEVDSMANLQLFDSSPTYRYVAESGLGISSPDEVSNAPIYAVFKYTSENGFTVQIIEGEPESPKRTIYTGKFELNEGVSVNDIQDILWTVTFTDDTRQNINLRGSTGGTVPLNDAYGSVSISPCVANDAKIVLEGLHITNGNATLNSTYNAKLTFKSVYDQIDGGSTMFSNDVEANASDPWGTRIYFLAFGSLATTSNSYIYIESSLTSTMKQTLASYTENYRWEYRRSGFNDYTQLTSSTLVDGGKQGKLYFRLACDWKEFSVSFAVMNTYVSTSVSAGDVSNFAIDNGLKSSGGKVSSSQGSTTARSVSYTLLYGDKIAYDFETESFTITNTHKDNNATITISVDSSSISSLFSQGWFSFTNKNSQGSITIGTLTEDEEYNCDGLNSNFYTSNTYLFALWLEEKVDVSVVVDQDQDSYTGVVNGHGTIGLSINNIKSSLTTSYSDKISHGIASASTAYYSTSSSDEYKNTGIGVSTQIRLIADATDATTKHKFVNFSYDDKNESSNQGKIILGTNGQEVTITAGAIASSCYCGDYTGTHIHVLYDAANTRSSFIAVDTINSVRSTVTTTLYGGYKVQKIPHETSTQVAIYNFWGGSVKTITVNYTGGGSTDTESTIYPRFGYRISETVSLIVSIGNLSISSDRGTMALTAGSYSEISENTIVLTGDIAGYNYVLGLVEYVYAVKLHLMVDYYNSSGVATVINGWNTEYVDKITLGTGMTLNGSSSIIISALAYGNNLGMYYDTTDIDNMGMVLGVYNSSDTRTNKIFVQNNGQHTLLGLDIYPTDASIHSNNWLASSNYYGEDNSGGTGNLSMMKSQIDNSSYPYTNIATSYFDCPKKLIDNEYYLVIRLQERTTSKIMFQLTLPYTSDMDNMFLRSNMVDRKTRSEYFISNTQLGNGCAVDGGIKFNAGHTSVTSSEIRNFDEYLAIGRGFTVKTSGSGDSECIEFYKNGVFYGDVSIARTNLYEIVGWYVKENDGCDLLVPGTATVGGHTFDIWSPDTTNTTQISSSGVSIDCDSTIYLVMRRAEVNITYDNGAWWSGNATNVGSGNAYYDINTMLRYDYLKDKFTGTSATYPGGLVAVIPSDIGSAPVFSYPSETSGGSQIPRLSTQILSSSSSANSIIRSGVYITYADNDVVTRVQGMLDGTTSKGTKITASKFTDNSIAIVGGMSTASRKTTFDVLLQDSNNWYFVGVPTGDVGANKVKVTLYDMPQSSPTDQTSYTTPKAVTDESGVNYFYFKEDTIQLLQSLALTTPDKPIDSISLYIAKDTNYRLYDGLYNETNGLYNETNGLYNETIGQTPSSSYSKIAFTYSTPYSGYSDPAGIQTPMLTGYTIWNNATNSLITTIKHEKSGSKYTNGLAEFDISSYSDISIYPYWELINVYKITITDSKGLITLPSITFVMEGETAYFTQEGFTSVTLNSKVSASAFETASYYTLQSGSYVFSGFVDKALDGAKTKYSTGTDTDFTNYGVLKVTAGTSQYTVDKGASISSTGVYSFSITPTQNVTLVAVWLQKGYTVNYSYVGGTPGGDSDVSDTSANLTRAITHSDLIEGMAFKVGQGFNWTTFTGTKFDTDGETDYTAATAKTNTVDKAFAITDGLAFDGYFKSKSSTDKWSANNLKLASELSGSGTTYTIYFKLTHDDKDNRHSLYALKSMYINKTNTIRNCKSGDANSHTYTVIRYWECFYCSYSTTETIDTTPYGTTNDEVYVQYNSTYCRSKITCNGCGELLDYDLKSHSMTVGPFIHSAATCTTNQYQNYKCEYCGMAGVPQEVPDTKLGHNLNYSYSWVDEDEGCTKGILCKGICTRSKNCSYSVESVKYDGSMLNHDYTTTYNDKIAHTIIGRVVKNCTYKYTYEDSGGNTRILQCPKCVKDSLAHKYSVDEMDINVGSYVHMATDKYYCSEEGYITVITFVCVLCNEDEGAELIDNVYTTAGGSKSYRYAANMLYWNGAVDPLVISGMDMFVRFPGVGYGHSKRVGRDECKKCGASVASISNAFGFYYDTSKSDYSNNGGFEQKIITFTANGLLAINGNNTYNYIAEIPVPSLSWDTGTTDTKIRQKIWDAFADHITGHTTWGYMSVSPPSGITGSTIVVC